MRMFAQSTLILAVTIIVLVGWFPLAWLLLIPVEAVLLLPVVWYVVFERHLERNDGELLLALQAVANAIRENREAPSRAEQRYR